MQQRSLRGNLVLLFADVTIRNSGALRDVAHAPNDARAGEHRLAQRLAGRRVTYQGKIAKIRAEGMAITQIGFCSKDASNSPRAQAQISGSLRRRRAAGRQQCSQRAELIARRAEGRVSTAGITTFYSLYRHCTR